MDLTTNKIYSGDCWEDVDFGIKHLKNKYKNKRIYAYGCSLGAIILTNYLIKSKSTDLKGAVGMSCPFDISYS